MIIIIHFALENLDFTSLEPIYRDTPSGERISLMVDLILQNAHFLADPNDLYVFNIVSFVKISLDEFAGYFRKWYKTFWKNYKPIKAKEAYEELRQESLYPDIHKPHLDYIGFQNGYWDCRENRFYNIMELVDEDLIELRIIGQFPNRFIESGEPPMFLTAMRQILPDVVARDKVLRYLRYCLSESIAKHRGQIWYGSGRNGKSSLAEFMVDLLQEHSTTFDIYALKTDPGRIVSLVEKRLAVCSEINAEYMPVQVQEKLKNLTGDRLLSGRAAYGTFVEWDNKVKFIVCTNSLPSLGNAESKSFYSRWDLIEFTEDFTGREDETLFQRIFRIEADLILSYLLREVPDTLHKVDWKQNRKIWDEQSSSTWKFIRDECELGDDRAILGEILYSHYAKWAHDKEIQPCQIRTFYDHIRRRGYIISHSNNKMVVKGLGLKNDDTGPYLIPDNVFLNDDDEFVERI